MDTDLERFCPYAPYTSVLTVIRHMRERNLKEPVTAQLITTINVAEGNAPRTIVALRFLGLLDEAGYITPNFRALENATDDEYPEVLENILREAYGHVFMALEPATASDQQFKNAFLYYQPKTQRPRMVMLFKGLCREATIMPGGAPDAIVRTRPSQNKSSTPTTAGSRKQPQVIPSVPLTPTAQITSVDPITQPNGSHIQQYVDADADYMILQNLIQQLPKGPDKMWTKSRRDRWLQAMAANIDVLIEVKEEMPMNT
jgi:Family of unknown function (DUF5343)